MWPATVLHHIVLFYSIAPTHTPVFHLFPSFDLLSSSVSTFLCSTGLIYSTLSCTSLFPFSPLDSFFLTSLFHLLFLISSLIVFPSSHPLLYSTTSSSVPLIQFLFVLPNSPLAKVHVLVLPFFFTLGVLLLPSTPKTHCRK